MKREIPRAISEGNREYSPCQMLLVAILNRGLLDLVDSNYLIRRESLAWFESKKETDWSFRWICQELNICRYRVLREVKKRVKLGNVPQYRNTRWKN